MPYWKNCDYPRVTSFTRSILLAHLAIFLWLPVPVFATGISVEHASSHQRQNSIVVNARIDFNLNEEVLLALTHGVTLYIDVTLKAERERSWIWDKNVAEATLRYSLLYHPLSNDYLVTDLNTDTRRQFHELRAALEFIGKVDGYEIFDANRMDPESNYIGYLRAKLNLKTLPAPLQPAAYFSREWRLRSAWYEWVIR